MNLIIKEIIANIRKIIEVGKLIIMGGKQCSLEHLKDLKNGCLCPMQKEKS